VEQHKPVIMRGIEKNSLAFKLWDEDYIREKYGDVELKLEPKIESRGDNHAYVDIEELSPDPENKDENSDNGDEESSENNVGNEKQSPKNETTSSNETSLSEAVSNSTKPNVQEKVEKSNASEDPPMRHRMSIKQFLSNDPNLSARNKNVYAVSIFPDGVMGWEPNVPSPALCGSRRHHLDLEVLRKKMVEDMEKERKEKENREKQNAESNDVNEHAGGDATAVAAENNAEKSDADNILKTEIHQNETNTTAIDPKSNLPLKPHPYPHPFDHSYVTHIIESNLWLANGETRSQLHYDKENIIMCLYRGEKEFIMIDTRKEFKNLYWARGRMYNGRSDFFNRGTDWVPIDTRRVDLRVRGSSVERRDGEGNCT
jgi:hypothetical protein